MQRTILLATAVLLVSVGLLLPSCCSNQDLVVIGSPEIRYDHNRQRGITAWGYTLPNNTPVSLGLPILARDRGVAVPPPDWVPGGGIAGEDGLREARLFVLFSGVELPLSNEVIDGAPSDKSDLVDYLGTGAQANRGLEPSEMPGAAPDQIKVQYKGILDMLGSTATLSGAESVQAWAEEHGAETTFQIVDSRFPAVAFKSDRIAVGWGEFWFVLFALPKGSGYSRLVVVPNPPGEQDFSGKTLTGR